LSDGGFSDKGKRLLLLALRGIRQGEDDGVVENER